MWSKLSRIRIDFRLHSVNCKSAKVANYDYHIIKIPHLSRQHKQLPFLVAKEIIGEIGEKFGLEL